MADGPEFSPEHIFESLNRNEVRYVVVGGIAALMHNSPFPTYDTDVCPASDGPNLERLATALKEMEARVFIDDEPGGLAFDPNASFLAENPLLNLVTRYGRLDVILRPAGSEGYIDLKRDAVSVQVRDFTVPIASLADVIRTKEAVLNRQDHSLPVLRQLLSRMMAAPLPVAPPGKQSRTPEGGANSPPGSP